MAATEAAKHAHHGRQQSFPPLPASPTLTNPDMILPDYGRGHSPELDLDARDHSPLMMWKTAHAAATTGDLQQMFITPSQQSVDHPYGPTGPITPTTPIIYGNGTMLSDIGEVTEVESTPGRPSPSRAKGPVRDPESPLGGGGGGHGTAAPSSPTLAAAAMLQRRSKQSLAAQRERRSSLESNSTITTQDQAALFADFDDSVSVGDSVFQGDDEESVASSYVDDTPVRDKSRLAIPNTDSLERMSNHSTTSLSRRAEEILANAKKRLTTMEGNLTRARSTLYVTSSGSMSSLGSGASTPSPPLHRAHTSLNDRETNPGSPSYSPGHSRVSSDVAMRNGLPYRVSTQTRSQSALGAAGGYRQPLTSSRSVDHIRGHLDREHSHPVHKATITRDNGLETLSEDDVAQGLHPDEQRNGAMLNQFLSPTFGSFSHEHEQMHAGGKGLVRSASVAQMRDLKDQMKDLKGKISSLREQARADSIKRRSLQSLRTPSPFTHSRIDQWYAEPKPNGTSDTNEANNAAVRNPWNGEESSVDGDPRENKHAVRESFVEDDESIYSEVMNQTPLRPATGQSPEKESFVDEGRQLVDDASDILTENGDEEETPEGFQDVVDLGYDSESGESLYHDTMQHPISHEDREDAFDYEHFFLHSAMGTISQQRLARQASRSSFSSEDSVETTRGPIVETNKRTRRHSDASVSTVETFATADEGRSTRQGGKETTDRGDANADEDPDRVPEGPSKKQPDSPEPAIRSSSASNHTKMSTSAHTSVASLQSASTGRDSDGSISSIPEEGSQGSSSGNGGFRASIIRRPKSSSATASMHRPSVSSFESTGTNRSFPLVNKPKASSTGGPTPNPSPDQELRSISDILLNETASVCEREGHNAGRQHHVSGSISSTSSVRSPSVLANNPNAPPAMQALMREDQYLIERLVASTGRCVLGLTESGRASSESRMYRRRLDLARRILEGLELAEVQSGDRP